MYMCVHNCVYKCVCIKIYFNTYWLAVFSSGSMSQMVVVTLPCNHCGGIFVVLDINYSCGISSFIYKKCIVLQYFYLK
jgi:hypothetical protein